jgi:hypothetical protein
MISALSLVAAALTSLHAQTQPSPAFLAPPPVQMMAGIAPSQPIIAAFASLPEAPSAVHPPADAEFAAIFAVPCHSRPSLSGPDADSGDGAREPCAESPNPYTRFLDSSTPIPLTPAQKARLALRDITDPGNIATIANIAAFTVALNSRTAYGPGAMGFAKDTGYSLLQDATCEFFGTFLIPSIAHEDPHYHRLPNASFRRRFLHAVSRTVIAQSDFGTPMPNFAALLTYPIANEIANLYVPGINGNGPSTVARIMTGYAADPVDNLITEFLPDVARRIHIRVIFVQRVLNQISLSQNPISSDQYSLP